MDLNDLIDVHVCNNCKCLFMCYEEHDSFCLISECVKCEKESENDGN
jgi:hypothetical protein